MDSLPPPKSEQASSSQSDPGNRESDNLRSLTRLIVGGVFIGIDELSSRLSRWEGETTRRAVAASKKSSQGSSSVPPPFQEETKESDSQTIRYALVGLAFEAQDAIKESAKAISKAEKSIVRRTDPIIKPITSSRLFSPARKRFNHLVDRGQQEVNRWVSIGRQEDSHSKALTQVAISESVDDVIDVIAVNPEIQQLITAQTTGLVEEILEEIRERTISTDIFLEGVVRSILRRKPRYQLPSPPSAVQNRAKTFRPKAPAAVARGNKQPQ